MLMLVLMNGGVFVQDYYDLLMFGDYCQVIIDTTFFAAGEPRSRVRNM